MNWIFKIILISANINLAFCCNRTPVSTNAGKSPADDRYHVGIGGNPQSYEPLNKYNVTLTAVQGYFFIGFNLAIENVDSKLSSDSSKLGHWEIVDYAETRYSERCANLISHTNTLQKSKIQVLWTAPPPGAGCVLFRATVIEQRDVWYMDDGFLTKQFCEEQQEDVERQPAQLPECCACDEAKYELVFEGKWSRHTHPKDFPANNWKTYFSDIIGASHTANYRFWEYGEMASDGLREVAEHGSTRTLEAELKQRSDEIRTIIKARGIAYPNVTGKTFAVFRVDSVHHLISLVSMINPSPDWIVGVSGLELCLSNCTWVEHKVHNLYPWDAGTDAGPSYMSADQPQVPPDVIRRIKSNFPNDLRSPFYDPTGAPMKPMARLHITRRRLYDKNCGIRDQDSGNIGDPTTNECAVTNYGKWSACDRKCGPGKRTRSRFYKNEAAALNFNCDVPLEEEKPCEGTSCGGGNTEEENSDFPTKLPQSVDDPDCELTDWKYGTCNVTCGTGYLIKKRDFKKRKAKKKCRTLVDPIFEEIEECEGDCTTGDVALQDVDYNSDYNVRKKQIDSFSLSRNHNNHHSIPAECIVSDWGLFSPCNASCGRGFQVRSRTVYNNALRFPNSFRANDNINDKCGRIPREEYFPCEETDCRGKNPVCFKIPRSVPCGSVPNPYWYYDPNDDKCGVFFDGECKNNINVNKFSSKEKCEEICAVGQHELGEMQSESLKLEPVDCLATEWHTSHCNATCGTGYQRKTRKILKHAKYGGKPCPTRLEKIYKCWVQCPMDEFSKHETKSRQNERQMLQIKCEYSNWSPWSPCSRSCGENGMRQRTRYLINPEYNSQCRDRLQSEKCILPSCSYESCEGMFC